MGNYSFSKAQRLASEKSIQELFQKGSSFYLHPFKVVFLKHPTPDCPHHQILISVPNRNFKKAVDRNTIKRRIREAYRLQQQLLSSEKKYLIAYIYTAKEILPSGEIHKKLALTFSKLTAQNEKV